ncbi:glycosyl hydrolase family 18 protein [Paenibacillus sp. FJAT-26967]|uniref:glycosyl hydrolase family 18 protein n=1 Tax=Paenibacillus sp. FJAT-26967 TaxID=1729690 RepID=UPI0020A53890|nr:glycosyl hydrolase family 18 protein [Paenibacillus sp. FJAT-26967]
MNDRQPSSTGRPGTRNRFRNFVLLFLLIAGITYLGMQVLPSKEEVQPDYMKLDKPVFYQGQAYEISAIGRQKELKLPLDLVQQWIDPTVRSEPGTASVILTTEDKVVRLQTDQTAASVNLQTFPLTSTMQKQGDQLFLPVDILKQVYGIDLRESADSGAILMFTPGERLRWGRLNKESGIELRTGPAKRMPIVSMVPQDEKILIWEEVKGWYKVQRTSGAVGFIPAASVTEETEEVIPERKTEPAISRWKPQGKLNMTWEHVVKGNPQTASIPEMPGLNVISPTWFHLADGQGNLKSLANADYVKWAHSRDYQVWALVSNSFEPVMTGEALASYETRIHMIKQLLAFAEQYNLQGINVDFENMNKSDGVLLVQFLREMTPLLHAKGLIVSVDVTAKSGSDSWSRIYDRPALAAVADYMILMAYDEHWASSPKSGSVASIPWVERSLRGLLEEDKIPPSKLVLGIPFYTRIWTEEKTGEGTKVSSKAVFMEKPRKLIEEKGLKPIFDEKSGQNYVEYTENGQLNRIWLEDATSIQSRIELVHKYDLAGVASWRRGFEDPALWQIIQSDLSKRD